MGKGKNFIKRRLIGQLNKLLAQYKETITKLKMGLCTY